MASNTAGRSILLMAAASAVMLGVVGCAAGPKAQVVGQAGDVGGDDEVAFWSSLDRVPLVSNGDAVYAMTLYASHQTGMADSGAYANRVMALKKADLLQSDFHEDVDAAVDRGTMARFVAVALKLPRGLTASIVGLNGRYALRELQFRGLLPESSSNQTLSGPELIGMLDRASQFDKAAHPVTPAVTTPPQPGTPNPQLPTANAPLPGIELASRSLDAMMLALADAPPPPATAPGQYVFTEITGGVYVLPAGAAKRVKVKPGTAVDENTEIQTIINATAKLVGPHGEQITLEPLTKATLKTFTAPGGVNATRVQMERGQIGAQIDTTPIEAAGTKYDLQLQSPRSTLAIKGTRVALYDQPPYDVEARSFTGTAVFEQFQRQKVAFGRKNGGLVTVTGQSPDPTSVALAAATEDPGARNARSDSEANVISSYFSRSSPIRFDRFTELPTVFGGRIPQNQQQFQPFFTGTLNLAITWEAPTNLNIVVFEPNTPDGKAGRLIYPYGALARTDNGTPLIPFDNRGGKHGGFEIVSIPVPQDMSTYTVFAQNLGKTATNVTVDAFSTDKPVFVSKDFGQTSSGHMATSLQPAGAFGASQPFLVFYDSNLPGQNGDGTKGGTGGGTGLPGGVVIPQQRAKRSAKPAVVGPVAPAASPRKAGK